MRNWKFIGSLVTIIVLGALGWAVNRFVWFGPDLQPKDYALELRKLQVGSTGASTEDFRAHEHLVRMTEKIAAIEAGGQREPDMKPFHEMSEEDLATTTAWIEALEQAGLFEDFRALEDFTAYVYPWDGVQIFGTDYAADTKAIRTMVRAGRYRSEVSLDAGEAELAMEAIRAQVGAARLMVTQPIAIVRLYGFAALASSMELSGRTLRHGLSSEQLNELTSRYDAVEIAPLKSLFPGERLLAEEAIASTFPQNRTIRIRSRGALTTTLHNEFDRASNWATLSLSERRKSPLKEPELGWGEMPVEILLPGFEMLARTHDQITCYLHGFRVWLAIERYRQARGSLPGSLDELIPDFLAELPSDPYRETPALFGYRVVEVSDEAPDGCVLYTVGYDGNDDGGTPSPDNPLVALTPDAPGTDYILNRTNLD